VVLPALFFAYATGAVWAIILLVTHKAKRGTEIAFGTFLTAGTFFAMFQGQRVIDWYLRFLS